MTTIQKTVAIERQGWGEIRDLLAELSGGRLEPKFNDEVSQRSGFDVVALQWQFSGGASATLECKVEEKHTGNLFIETWSNKSYGRQKPGWMVTMKADWLLYYFLDEKALYMIPMPRLWDWFYGTDERPAAFVSYREVEQKKNSQPNKTCGRLVPIGHVYRNVKFYEYRFINGGWEQHADMYCDDKQKYQVMSDWNGDLAQGQPLPRRAIPVRN